MTSLCWKNKQGSSAHIYKLESSSYHWHKPKTLVSLKLNLVEHHTKYFQVLKLRLLLLCYRDALLNRIHTNLSHSLKNLLEAVYKAEFIVPNVLSNCTIRCQNLSKSYHWEMTEIGLLNGYFWNQIDML